MQQTASWVYAQEKWSHPSVRAHIWGCAAENCLGSRRAGDNLEVHHQSMVTKMSQMYPMEILCGSWRQWTKCTNINMDTTLKHRARNRRQSTARLDVYKLKTSKTLLRLRTYILRTQSKHITVSPHGDREWEWMLAMKGNLYNKIKHKSDLVWVNDDNVLWEWLTQFAIRTKIKENIINS